MCLQIERVRDCVLVMIQSLSADWSSACLFLLASCPLYLLPWPFLWELFFHQFWLDPWLVLPWLPSMQHPWQLGATLASVPFCDEYHQGTYPQSPSGTFAL